MKKLLIFPVIVFLSLVLFSACVGPLKKQELTPSPSPEYSPEVLGEADIEVVKAPSIVLEEGQSLYVADIDESTISWSAKKTIGDRHSGQVNLAAGNIIISGESLVQADFVIDMESISNSDIEGVGKEKLETHLKSEDFFAVEKYPLAELMITSAKKQDEETYELSGSLTIKDITQEISFPATVSEIDGVISAQAQFSIDRTLWDIRFGSDKFFDNLADNVVEDEINFDIKIIAKI